MSGEIEHWQFACTALAGQGVGNPVIVPCNLPAGQVIGVKVIVPPGPRGKLGFAIGMSGQRVIPSNGQPYIYVDNQVMEFNVPESYTSGAWQVFLSNAGAWPHTIFAIFVVERLDEAFPAPTTPGVEFSGTVVQ
jgi:hypothetical protein